MAKNRKHKSVAIRFGPAIKALLLCALFVVSGVGYVWQKSLIADLERQVTGRKQELEKLETKNKKLREDLSKLTSPEALNRRLADEKLGLVKPQPTQVVWMVEPVAPPLAEPSLPSIPAPALGRYAARR